MLLDIILSFYIIGTYINSNQADQVSRTCIKLKVLLIIYVTWKYGMHICSEVFFLFLSFFFFETLTSIVLKVHSVCIIVLNEEYYLNYVFM